MVGRLATGRAGKINIGCLASLAALALIVYVGIGAGGGFLRYVRMKDEMGVQARFATNLGDAEIRARIRATADTLGLPRDARKITIRRRGRPREIIITTSWPDTIVLPFYRIPITYRPEVRAPL
jgi:hypothetical protein